MRQNGFALLILGICMLAGVAILIRHWRTEANLQGRAASMHQCIYLAAFDSNLKDDHVVTETGARTISWRWFAHFGIGMGTQISEEQMWSAKANASVAEDTHSAFANKSSVATVFAVRGPGTAFDVAIGKGLESLPNDALLLVEVCGSDCNWIQPGDIWLSDESPEGVKRISLEGAARCENGFHIAFADGAVWQMASETPPESLREMAIVEVAKAKDREEVLGRFTLSKRTPFLRSKEGVPN